MNHAGITSPKQLSPEQIQILSAVVERKENAFITGAAGTGKSTMLEHIRNQLDLKKMIVAPTGVAALNIGGNTINSAFRIGFDTIPEITKSKDPRFGKLLKNLELLIIDEISMVRAPMLDAISQSLQIHLASNPCLQCISTHGNDLSYGQKRYTYH